MLAEVLSNLQGPGLDAIGYNLLSKVFHHVNNGFFVAVGLECLGYLCKVVIASPHDLHLLVIGSGDLVNWPVLRGLYCVPAKLWKSHVLVYKLQGCCKL